MSTPVWCPRGTSSGSSTSSCRSSSARTPTPTTTTTLSTPPGRRPGSPRTAGPRGTGRRSRSNRNKTIFPNSLKTRSENYRWADIPVDILPSFVLPLPLSCFTLFTVLPIFCVRFPLPFLSLPFSLCLYVVDFMHLSVDSFCLLHPTPPTKCKTHQIWATLNWISRFFLIFCSKKIKKYENCSNSSLEAPTCKILPERTLTLF